MKKFTFFLVIFSILLFVVSCGCKNNSESREVRPGDVITAVGKPLAEAADSNTTMKSEIDMAFEKREIKKISSLMLGMAVGSEVLIYAAERWGQLFRTEVAANITSHTARNYLESSYNEFRCLLGTDYCYQVWRESCTLASNWCASESAKVESFDELSPIYQNMPHSQWSDDILFMKKAISLAKDLKESDQVISWVVNSKPGDIDEVKKVMLDLVKMKRMIYLEMEIASLKNRREADRWFMTHNNYTDKEKQIFFNTYIHLPDK